MALHLGLRGPRHLSRVGAAAGDPTLPVDIDFTTGALDSRITFTRASPGTYFNSSGVLSSAATDAARFDYDSALAARGLLLEGQRTNLITYSNDFSNAIWQSLLSASKVGAGSTGPDGAPAYEITFAGGTAASGVYNEFSATNGTTYTNSVYVKAKSGTTTVRVRVWDGGAGTYSADTTVNDTTWTRVTATRAATSTSATANITIANNAAGNATAVYVSCAQVEAGSFATSYISTAAATATRAADIATMTGTNFSDWYVAATGTFVVEFDVLSIAAGTRGLLSADNNTADERIELYNSTADPKTIIVDGGATQADLDGGTLVANTAAKLGLSYAANDAAACLSGGAVQTDVTVTLPAPDRLRIGVNQAGNYLHGHIKSLKYYNVAKSDADLQTLTT
jgi:hypothetical protein